METSSSAGMALASLPSSAATDIRTAKMGVTKLAACRVRDAEGPRLPQDRFVILAWPLLEPGEAVPTERHSSSLLDSGSLPMGSWPCRDWIFKDSVQGGGDLGHERAPWEVQPNPTTYPLPSLQTGKCLAPRFPDSRGCTLLPTRPSGFSEDLIISCSQQAGLLTQKSSRGTDNGLDSEVTTSLWAHGAEVPFGLCTDPPRAR